FTLSPFDLASGTTTFEIIPEPASLALLLIGGLLIRRR
ncbi:MAG: PEP-CTERM sorting domain-containing protein, partial [Planctomycetes bacterium]|nr:PEP-CTERM sorting domain-containing protein [Planctomycetota bacterium]